MSGFRDIFQAMKHPKVMQEFGQYSQAILPVMTDPNISRETKRETLNDLVNRLAEYTFKLDIVAEQIIEIIDTGQKSDAICKEYDDTDAQVMGILEWCPRMDYHKDKLYKVVRANRKRYGLEL